MPETQRTGFSESSGDGRNVNWHMLIRNLVVDGGIGLNEVLEMNPRQILAICTEKSQAPGLLRPDMIVKGVANMKGRIDGW